MAALSLFLSGKTLLVIRFDFGTTLAALSPFLSGKTLLVFRFYFGTILAALFPLFSLQPTPSSTIVIVGLGRPKAGQE